jgi:PKD repeat protein
LLKLNRLAITAAGLCILCAGFATAAGAHGPESKGAAARYASEAAVLGEDHAREHLRGSRQNARALRRWRRMPPAKRHRLRRKAERQATATATGLTLAAGTPQEVGQWTTPPFRLPNYAINTALLPTGKVIMYGYPPNPATGPRPNYGLATIWDPALGTGPESLTEVPPPPIDHDDNPATPPVQAPLFCSGLSLLPSGELLVTGGNLLEPTADKNDSYTEYAGAEEVFTFDPWTESWTQQPSMQKGRWYPTQTLLADGRTTIVGGYTEDAPGGVLTNLVEEYLPAAEVGGQGSVGLLSGAERKMSLYPRMFLLPDGDVLMAGTGRWHVAKLHAETPGSGRWTSLGQVAPLSHHHVFGTAVLGPGTPDGSWLVTSIGGTNGIADGNGNTYGTTTVETLDARTPSSGWAQGPPLQVPRAHHNTVVLPDGSMVTVGGGLGTVKPDRNWALDPAGQQRQVELYDPATRQWRLGAAQVEDRAYHSTALLLPDGRVLSAGDDHNPKVGSALSTFDTAEIYTPPYLLRAGAESRPVISDAPGSATWGAEFEVEAQDDVAPPAKAVLMAPGAVTHGVDMSGRRIELEVTAAFDPITGRMRLKAPPAAEVAPPGHYMLFLLSEDGVPSEASWIQLGASGNAAPTAVATADPSTGGAPLTVNFDGTGSSDPEGDPLTYAWDLDGDGEYDDSSSAAPSFTYTQNGAVDVGLRVTDGAGLDGTDTVTIVVGNSPPAAQIDAPAGGFSWKVAQQISFAGTGTDAEEGVLPASAFDWDVVLKHCPGDCHEHPVQSFDAVKSGSFAAPDHGYPSHLELKLTVTDAGGLSDTETLRLDPRTVNVTMALAQPHFAPLRLTLNSETAPAPFTRPVIEGSTNTISAPTPQVGAQGRTYDFYQWWYIGRHQTRTVKVNAATTYTAAFRKR